MLNITPISQKGKFDNVSSDVDYYVRISRTVQHLWVRVRTASEKERDSHNAKMQRTDPGTKVMGEFSTKVRIFVPNSQN